MNILSDSGQYQQYQLYQQQVAAKSLTYINKQKLNISKFLALVKISNMLCSLKLFAKMPISSVLHHFKVMYPQWKNYFKIIYPARAKLLCLMARCSFCIESQINPFGPLQKICYLASDSQTFPNDHI